eukprot:8635_1
MKVRVRTFSGWFVQAGFYKTLDIEPSNTIEEVKSKIAAHYLAGDKCLIHTRRNICKRLSDDNRTVFDYGINKDSILHITLPFATDSGHFLGEDEENAQHSHVKQEEQS